MKSAYDFDSGKIRLFFKQIWVYGNSYESFLVAVVNPNKQAVEKWAAANDISGDFDSLCNNPKVKEHILGELTKTGKEKKVLAYIFSRSFVI